MCVIVKLVLKNNIINKGGNIVNVMELNYQDLVLEMAKAHIPDMEDVLSAKLKEIGQPKTKNEVRYFWGALFNAARVSGIVWVWLCTAPHIRRFAPSEAQLHIMPQFAGDIPLPVIGGPDDEPYQASEGPKQYPAEPTEENFREQTEVLDEYLREEAKKDPESRCKDAQGYVKTFYYSGTATMMASVQLIESGLNALATEAGLDYLRKTYPPKK